MRKSAYLLIILYFLNSEVLAADYKIKSMHIYGNVRTHKRGLLSKLNIKDGEFISIDDFKREKNFLLRESILKNVEFRLKPVGNYQDFSVLILVKERGIFSFDPIIGDNDMFGFYLGTGVNVYNLLGYGDNLKILFQKGKLNKKSVCFGNKWFGPSSMFLFYVGYSNVSFPYLFNDVESNGELKQQSLTSSLGIHLTRELLAVFNVGKESVTFENSVPMASRTNTDNLSFVGLKGTIDTRDWPSYPAEGIFVNLDYKQWMVSGSSTFKQVDLEMRAYSHLRLGSIVALRLKFINSIGKVPFYKLVHMGGGRTLRGYRTGSIFGDRALLVSAEFRQPLLYIRKPMSGMHMGLLGIFFIDSGAAWFADQIPMERMFHTSAGFGLHLVLDKLVLRVEYGYRGKGMGFLGAGTGVMF